MKQSPGSDRIPFYVAGGFVLLLLVLHPLGTFGPIDDKWVDQMFRWRGMESADPRITLVAIDDEAIKQVGQYPWPRSVYPKVLDKLFKDGAKVVGLDVIFPDPSIPAEDAVLVDYARKWRDHLVFACDWDPGVLVRHAFRFPFPALHSAVKYFGAVNQPFIDRDEVIRSAPLVVGSSLDAHHWPADKDRQYSLGLKTLAVYEGRDPEEYLGRRFVLHLNVRGEALRPTTLVDRGKKVVVNEQVFGIRRISAGRVLTGRLSDEERDALKGGIVLIGSTARAAFDHFPSPFTDSSPGVEVHATVIDNLLNHRELRSIAPWKTLLVALAFALASAWCLALNPLMSALVIVLALAGWVFGNVYAFHHFLVLQFTTPTLALIGPFIILTVRRTYREHSEKRFIKQTFGQFVAPEVVDDLIKDPSKIKLGGQKREMSMFFMDIEGFTKISEQMDPETLIWALNRYLTRLSQVIQKNKGMVDKYVGDCIVAIWNAPLEQKDHRKLACLAAIECQEMIPEINRELQGRVPRPFAARIGVNSGVVTVGLMGSEQKLQYTVIGDDVNAASRLEGANKFFGSKIMVAESCFEDAKDEVEARLLGSIRVVGKATPLKVYELLGRKGALPDMWKRALPLYQSGIAAFQVRKFKDAKAKFSELLKIIPDDGPAKLYLNMAEDYTAIAPPAEWDGVFNLQEK